MGSFGEVAGVFLSRKHSPDTLREGTGRWPLASGVLSGAAECTGRTGESPVLSVWCAGGLATLSARESGEHRTLRVRPVTVRVCGALCARVRCGLVERPVVLCQARARGSRWWQRSSSNG